jgi:hypothetical protein
MRKEEQFLFFNASGINTKKVDWDGLEKKMYLWLYDIIFFSDPVDEIVYVWIEKVVPNGKKDDPLYMVW